MRAFHNVNLAEPLHEDPDRAAALSRIGSVEVREGKLVVTPTARP
jgi:hypothetical protein